MRIRWLSGVGRIAKRVLRQDASPGVARIAGGERPQALASRRGILGWTWAFLVVLMFVSEVRKEHRHGHGILLCDRHLLDALVTLDVVYEGVPLQLQRALIRRLLPPADVTLLLTVPVITALARKPEDMFDEAALARQANRYGILRPEVLGLRELDGTRPSEELAAEAFRIVAGVGSES
jgi:hypothetical protein